MWRRIWITRCTKWRAPWLLVSLFLQLAQCSLSGHNGGGKGHVWDRRHGLLSPRLLWLSSVLSAQPTSSRDWCRAFHKELSLRKTGKLPGGGWSQWAGGRGSNFSSLDCSPYSGHGFAFSDHDASANMTILELVEVRDNIASNQGTHF